MSAMNLAKRGVLLLLMLSCVPGLAVSAWDHDLIRTLGNGLSAVVVIIVLVLTLGTMQARVGQLEKLR